MRDGLDPTVLDQGIAFDENNNLWIKPTDTTASDRCPPLLQELNNQNGNEGSGNCGHKDDDP